MKKINNLFADIPDHLPDELFESLLETSQFRIERIVSRGHATAPGDWYDQEWDEWVVLLRGSAGLRVENEPEVKKLRPGDYLHLPAHQRHRVEWTDPDQETIWLAIHIAGNQ